MFHKKKKILGGEIQDLPLMDGISKWNMITGKQRSTDNYELIHNINGNTMGIRKGPWKFIRSKIPKLF